MQFIYERNGYSEKKVTINAFGSGYGSEPV